MKGLEQFKPRNDKGAIVQRTIRVDSQVYSRFMAWCKRQGYTQPEGLKIAIDQFMSGGALQVDCFYRLRLQNWCKKKRVDESTAIAQAIVKLVSSDKKIIK